MAVLTLIVPQGQAMVNVEDGVLVFDKTGNWVPVDIATYVTLVETYSHNADKQLLIGATLIAKVIDITPAFTVTDPNVLVQEDPSGGQCVCLITCQGTNISYIKVNSI